MKIKLTKVGFFFRKKLLITIMRAFIFLLCTTVFSFNTSNVISQNAKIKIDADETLTVDEVFDLIMDQTDYKFIYQMGIFKDFPRINVKKGIIRANKLLQKSLSAGNLNTVVTADNTILIIEKTRIDQKLQQQVSGKVTDETGLPVPGATVMIKGTTTGTSTNFDGNYTLKVPFPENVLVFSFLGFETQEISVESNTTIDVVLKKDNQELEEVVLVSTGFQTIAKERATGSFAFIDEEGLEQRITTNLTDRLEGLVPGLTVKQDGRIEIRGQGTLFGDSNPLVVVDGFPLESDISTINPSDIQTITVLKDAAAASIYGAQAANGVIVITTHKVRKNSGVKIEASVYKTITFKNDFDDLQYESAADRVELELSGMQYRADNGWLSTSGYNLRPYVVNSPIEEVFLRNYFQGDSGFDQSFAYSTGERDAILDQLRNTNGFAQIEKYLMRDAVLNQFNISLRQGGENNQFYGSLTYNSDQTTLIGNNSDRIIANLKNTLQLSEKVRLQLGANIVYSSGENNSPLALGTRSFLYDWSPYKALVDDSGNRIQYNQINFLEVPKKDAQGYLPHTYSPLDVLDENDNTSSTLATRLSATLDMEIIDGLVFTSKFQYERNHVKSEQHYKITHPKWREKVNSYTLYDDADGSLTYQLPMGGRLVGNKGETFAWIARNQLAYDKSFQDGKHAISVLGGMETRKFSTYTNTYQLLGYDENTLTSGVYDIDGLINYSPDIRTWYGFGNFWEADVDRVTDYQKRDVSYFGNASYIYDGKYILSASGRLDQANIYGLDTSARDNFLWSSGFSWALSKENFFDVSWVDKLTLRATYGVNGNRPAPGQTSFLTGRVRYSWFVENELAISLTNPANPGLKSEKVKAFNLGLDYRLFNGKLNGSLEYYNKNSTELIGQKEINPTNGWSSAFVNYAELKNSGIELNLNAKIISTDNFDWRTTFNFSKNTNEITEVDLEPSWSGHLLNPFSSGGYLIKGEPLGRLYAYRWGGLDENGKPQIIDGAGATIGWQEARSRGFDKDLFEDQGTTIAPYYGGWNNTFKYKNFRLNILLTYKFGHKMKAFRGFDGAALYYATSANLTGAFIADRWRQPGDEATTDVPGFDIFDFSAYRYYTYYKNSNINTLSANYIRLTDVNLSYDISSLLKNNPFDRLTINLQGKNLWLWTANDENIDPEANFNGVLRFPRSKSFVIGIEAHF